MLQVFVASSTNARMKEGTPPQENLLLVFGFPNCHFLLINLVSISKTKLIGRLTYWRRIVLVPLSLDIFFNVKRRLHHQIKLEERSYNWIL